MYESVRINVNSDLTCILHPNSGLTCIFYSFCACSVALTLQTTFVIQGLPSVQHHSPNGSRGSISRGSTESHYSLNISHSSGSFQDLTAISRVQEDGESVIYYKGPHAAPFTHFLTHKSPLNSYSNKYLIKGTEAAFTMLLEEMR